MADYNSTNGGDVPQKVKVTKVISGTARVNKKSKTREFFDMFMANDIEDVKSYILTDVVIPAIKDSIESTVHAILHGKSQSSQPKLKGSYIQYNNIGQKRNALPSATAPAYGYGEVIVNTREEAHDILDRMDELVSTYQFASVADLYDMAGIEPKFTDNRYGWKDIRGAQIIPAKGGGFLIKMPKAYPLD